LPCRRTALRRMAFSRYLLADVLLCLGTSLVKHCAIGRIFDGMRNATVRRRCARRPPHASYRRAVPPMRLLYVHTARQLAHRRSKRAPLCNWKHTIFESVSFMTTHEPSRP
jgi:hypothetical protein